MVSVCAAAPAMAEPGVRLVTEGAGLFEVVVLLWLLLHAQRKSSVVTKRANHKRASFADRIVSSNVPELAFAHTNGVTIPRGRGPKGRKRNSCLYLEIAETKGNYWHRLVEKRHFGG